MSERIFPVTDDDPSSASGAAGQALAQSFIGVGEPFTPPGSVVAAAARLLGTLAQGARRTVARVPGHNPGHTVKVHPGGLYSASSSAPRNPRQHTNLAPPSHQRFDPGAHPSATRAVLSIAPDLMELL